MKDKGETCDLYFIPFPLSFILQKMSELQSFFADVSAIVHKELDWLIPQDDRQPRRLRDAIRWSLFAGGKHLRPALVFAVGRTFGATDDKLVRTAAAVEMVHTYSLIHDDLPSMDDDDLRRGRETCHKKFGEATAILAGDALQVLSFQAIAEEKRLPVETRIELISRLSQAAVKMVVGQQMDLDAEGKAVSLEQIENIHRNKTGALICFSAEAGAIIGGADPKALKTVSSIGEKLGLLFQIRDDMLDVTQTTEALGKTAGKDTTSAKATYPAVRGLERTQQLANEVHADVVRSITELGPPASVLIRIADFILTRKS